MLRNRHTVSLSTRSFLESSQEAWFFTGRLAVTSGSPWVLTQSHKCMMTIWKFVPLCFDKPWLSWKCRTHSTKTATSKPILREEIWMAIDRFSSQSSQQGSTPFISIQKRFLSCTAEYPSLMKNSAKRSICCVWSPNSFLLKKYPQCVAILDLWWRGLSNSTTISKMT